MTVLYGRKVARRISHNAIMASDERRTAILTCRAIPTRRGRSGGDVLTYRCRPKATIWLRTVVHGAPAIEPLRRPATTVAATTVTATCTVTAKVGHVWPVRLNVLCASQYNSSQCYHCKAKGREEEKERGRRKGEGKKKRKGKKGGGEKTQRRRRRRLALSGESAASPPEAKLMRLRRSQLLLRGNLSSGTASFEWSLPNNSVTWVGHHGGRP